MGFQQLLNALSTGASKLSTGASKSAEASRLAYLEGEYHPSILKSVPGVKNLGRQQRAPKEPAKKLGLDEADAPLPEGFSMVAETQEELQGIPLGYEGHLKRLGVSFKETPIEALGAFGTRLLTDLTNDGTRGIYWRYNDPRAIVDIVGRKIIGAKAYEELGPTKTGLIGASIIIPATAAAGHYDIFNPGELFRPKGYAQAYAEEGSEDRRETSQPVPELFERFFLGRTGRPLNYETAKKDIPSLTPERYGNYMRNYYQDKGFLGLIKATPENLQGVPEVRMLGVPVTIPSATAAIGGIAGAATAIKTAPTVRASFKRGLAGAALGSGAGVIAGNLANTVLAAKATEQKLPTIGQYEMMQ